MFRAYPGTAGPSLDYREVLPRGPSPLTVAERELIAACVSRVNSCGYCHGVHTATAFAFGMAEDTLPALLADSGTALVEERLKPLLAYVGKLTRTPGRMTADCFTVSAQRLAEGGDARLKKLFGEAP
ncbi:carboxymuconolactone decarboxylase family protein [Amycolatopsis jejuensis]|uniref:carboxymuconolactone decarboxylase family protein n=1 Tax=Amycolatopsis jejuensis TaxID=330084 RepID=UPI000689893A|nr:carboxymuconolactone decarboxylase family protein [Amycolatopsis jejuensis]